MAEITLPDGRKISFPDGLQPEQVKKIIGAASQPAQAQAPGGIMHQIGQGLLEGAVGVASFPAHIGEWLGEKATGAIDKYALGKSDEEIQASRADFAKAREQINSPFDILNAEKNINASTGVGAPKTTGEKYARTISGFIPGSLAGPGSIVSKLGTALSAGAASEAAGQATTGKKVLGHDVEPYARLAGALLGGTAPAMARRAVTPHPMHPERQKAVQTLKKEGVDLTAGQATGSIGLRNLESELGGAAGQRIMEQQGEQFTAAALRRAGIQANRATPDVIDGAFKRIGNDFDTLSQRNTLRPDAQIAKDVADIAQEYTQMTAHGARPPVVEAYAKEALNIAANGMSGRSYQAMTSRMEKFARETSDNQVRSALRGIREALDDSMERGLEGTADAGKWKQARGEYRNLMVLEQAATGAGENAATGLISPSHLRNAAISKQTRRNYARGKGDYADLARAGEATMKPLPNSGTAGRTAARNLGAGALAVVGALLGQKGGSMVGLPLLGQAAGAAAGLAVPRGIAAAALSKPGRAYLTNQLLPNGRAITPAQRALIAALGSGNQGNRPQH